MKAKRLKRICIDNILQANLWYFFVFTFFIVPCLIRRYRNNTRNGIRINLENRGFHGFEIYY